MLLLSMKVIRMPLFYARWMLSASVRFLERALLIGTIELIKGIRIPMTRAVKVAFKDGMNDEPIAIESGKSSTYRK